MDETTVSRKLTEIYLLPFTSQCRKMVRHFRNLAAFAKKYVKVFTIHQCNVMI